MKPGIILIIVGAALCLAGVAPDLETLAKIRDLEERIKTLETSKFRGCRCAMPTPRDMGGEHGDGSKEEG